MSILIFKSASVNRPQIADVFACPPLRPVKACKAINVNQRYRRNPQISPCKSAEDQQSDLGQNREEQSRTSTSGQQDQGSFGKWAAGGAVALGVAAFLFARLSAGEITLSTLERSSLPLDTALSNNRPTLVEFYASWCEVCKELTPNVYQVKQEYKDDVNFVMLNIENPKWAPEVADFRVNGVPHFVFLNERGQPQAATVGRVPLQVLEGNVEALATRKTLPFRGRKGPTSTLAESTRLSGPQSENPRSHG